jgi:hypothetical protein
MLARPSSNALANTLQTLQQMSVGRTLSLQDIMPTILAVQRRYTYSPCGAENDHGEYPRGSLQNDHAPLDGTSETR